MLDKNKLEELINIYRLFSRVPDTVINIAN